ncbi:sporulation membrane protein YtrI [Pseudogracilibacillus auburnensis]|uniref:Sporulation membrane protein YtrI C-terminal domain-containing protein n=1 Tax=Pseudogracilibacillus auburnensis TaxID=1494959 RepID=A0A2V3VZ98_9BACI|nr:sporulation membrane protein YtrI [Pseudogracilibacillus auburnensis]MBO1003390.1 hypothetical protein [Pseudogracilibacillus auburnensis]PXW85305.1 hypothetical protein DFR56_11173 [Pseudogracilibacillus auburnensis]
MHVPPYHKKRSWQILIIGILIGSVIAYLVLAYMYGKMYENVLSDRIQLQSKITELERQNEALLHDKEELEEQKTISIHSIDIEFMNKEDMRFDRLITHQLEDLIKQEINDIIGKDVKSVAENDDLLVTVIENKTFTIDDLSYQFEVKKLYISEQVKLSLHVKLAK